MEVKLIQRSIVEQQQLQPLQVVFLNKLQNPVDSKRQYAALLQQLLDQDKFNAEDGQLCLITSNENGKLQDVAFVGLGETGKLTHEKIRKAAGKAVRKAKELKAKAVRFSFEAVEGLEMTTLTKAAVEGACLADYEFNKYKSDKKEVKIELLELVDNWNMDREISSAVEEGKLLADCTALARDLTNEPANVLRPIELAEKAKDAGAEFGFDVEVLNEDKIDELGMKAFQAVAQGSVNPPRLIVMKYKGNPAEQEKILGFVGKGLTFDSGGYSLKPTDGMVTMKSDMGGAAAVIGAISAISKAKLQVNVTAVVAACENMISGGAYKPGDIIGSMAGKRIEVLNSDAEGRLTLADAVHYAISIEKVTRVVDVATLTGAVLVALGTTIIGVVTNNQPFFSMLQNAADRSGERVWQLPSDEDYKKLIKSDIADLKNTGGRNAGIVTAGLFIGEFVGDCPWLHLDIAGTSWRDNVEDYFSKGGTGVGVRTLYELAKGTVNE